MIEKAILFFFLILSLVSGLYCMLYRYKQKMCFFFGATFKKRHLFFLEAVLAVCVLFFMTLSYLIPEKRMERGEKKSSIADEIAFVLDLSASMGVSDEKGGKTRLERSKEIIEATVRDFSGVPVSLYTFSGSLEEVVPPTLDYVYFLWTLQFQSVMDPTVPGTNFQALLEKIDEKYKGQSFEKKTHLVLLSDGEATEGKIGSIPSGGSWTCIGVGSNKGGEVPRFKVQSARDEQKLRRIAYETGGRYIPSELFSTLDIARKITGSLQGSYMSLIEESEYTFFIALLLAILFLLLFLLIPRRAFLLLLFLPLSLSANHFEKGLAYYDVGNYDTALQSFYEAKKEVYPQDERAILLYALATTHVAKKEYKEALEILERIRTEKDLIQQYVAHQGVYAALHLAEREKAFPYVQKWLPMLSEDEKKSVEEELQLFPNTKQEDEIVSLRHQLDEATRVVSEEVDYMSLNEELFSLVVRDEAEALELCVEAFFRKDENKAWKEIYKTRRKRTSEFFKDSVKRRFREMDEPEFLLYYKGMKSSIDTLFIHLLEDGRPPFFQALKERTGKKGEDLFSLWLSLSENKEESFVSLVAHVRKNLSQKGLGHIRKMWSLLDHKESGGISQWLQLIDKQTEEMQKMMLRSIEYLLLPSEKRSAQYILEVEKEIEAYKGKERIFPHKLSMRMLEDFIHAKAVDSSTERRLKELFRKGLNAYKTPQAYARFHKDFREILEGIVGEKAPPSSDGVPFKLSLEKAIDFLQQMQQDDIKEKKQPPIQHVEKPW